MVRLNVFEQQSSEIWGEISNVYCKKPIPCTDMGNFLLKLDALYENLKCLMADMHVRSFLECWKPILHGGPLTAEPAAYFDSNRSNLYQQLRQKKQNNEVAIMSQKSHIKPIGVFFINTIFRQHASWQGEVLWEKTGQKICFRSALELLHLIQSVLQESGSEDDRRSTALEQIKYSWKEG
jgi:hypothetical protein